ncbi:MAG: ABC transporter substrate-binding protein, partial [Coriobacteriia bacterium]
MKKKWSLIAAAAAALALAGCMLAGCGLNDAAKDSANSDTTKLIVGFDQSYPPYGFVGNDGNYTGFDLDLATEVANRNDWDIQLEAIDWDAKDTLLNSGAINC